MAKYILDFTEKYGMSFPGWEPERMIKLDILFHAYDGIDHEKLWANLRYFLEAIMPTCRECDISIRPDHGRHLWNEGPGNVRPGYGLYDRAMGIMYMLGVWDMLDKLDKQ